MVPEVVDVVVEVVVPVDLVGVGVSPQPTTKPIESNRAAAKIFFIFLPIRKNVSKCSTRETFSLQQVRYAPAVFYSRTPEKYS
jgi:hypothetical protein